MNHLHTGMCWSVKAMKYIGESNLKKNETLLFIAILFLNMFIVYWQSHGIDVHVSVRYVLCSPHYHTQDSSCDQSWGIQ